MEAWVWRSEERSPSRTLSSTSFCTVQKLPMSRTAKGRNDQRKIRVAKRILPSRGYLVAGGSIEGNDELDGGGAVVANLDTLAKHAGGFVPRDNGVAAGRHAVEGELAGPIGHRAPAVG